MLFSFTLGTALQSTPASVHLIARSDGTHRSVVGGIFTQEKKTGNCAWKVIFITHYIPEIVTAPVEFVHTREKPNKMPVVRKTPPPAGFAVFPEMLFLSFLSSLRPPCVSVFCRQMICLTFSLKFGGSFFCHWKSFCSQIPNRSLCFSRTWRSKWSLQGFPLINVVMRA